MSFYKFKLEPTLVVDLAAELMAAVSARYHIRAPTMEEPEIEAIVRRIYEEGL